MSILNVTVPLVVTPKSNGSHGKNTNWKAAKVREEKQIIMDAIVAADDLDMGELGADFVGWLARNPDLGARVTMLRPYVSSPLDDDNLGNALKDTRDVVASFLGEDDGSIRYHWRYVQCKARSTGKKLSKPKRKKKLADGGTTYGDPPKAPRMVPAYDTHVRIRIEIVPASDVDPLLTAVRVLRDAAALVLGTSSRTGDSTTSAPTRCFARLNEALAQADALATFNPLEMYR